MAGEGYDGLPAYYAQSSDPLTPNLGLSLKGMDPIIAENFVTIDTNSGGSKVEVNGASVTNPNFNNTTPAAQIGFTNVTWQVDGTGNVSASLQVGVSVNGTTVTGPNFNNTTPTAPSGFTNILWQNDGSGNISAYAPISGSFGTLYLDSAASTIAGYASLITTYPVSAQTTYSTSGSGAGVVTLIQAFASSALDLTTIPAGMWAPSIYASVDALTQTPQLQIDLYTRTSGGVETLQATLVVNFTSTAMTLYTPTVELGNISMNPTDLVVVKTSLKTGGASTRTATVYVDTGSVSHVHIPTSVLNTVVPWSSLANAQANLTLANAGFSTEFDQTSAATWTWANTAAASSGTSQSSPILTLKGQYWNGAASAADSWTIQDVVGTGTNGSSVLTFSHTGTSGQACAVFPAGSAGLPGLAFGSSSTGFTQVTSIRMATIVGNSTTSAQMDFYASTSLFLIYALNASAATFSIAGQQLNIPIYISSNISSGTNRGAVVVGTNNGFSATTGTQYGFSVGDPSTSGVLNLTFSPSSGTANFVGCGVLPTINQTSTSSGNYTGLLVNVKETSLKGTANKLLDLQAGATGGTSKFTVSNAGVLSTYNTETTAGVGTAYLRGVTSQKSETGADASILSVTPAAAAGTYRIAVVLSVSAASAATLGWTATWTDANGNAQTPTNLSLFTTGSASSSLTVTAAAGATYYGEWYVDVNNAGTAIVVKTTFSGTSIAYKATATVERVA